MKLEGKVAVLTGGEGPLGRVVSNEFLKEGAKLVIGWNSAEQWSQSKELIGDGFEGQYIDVQFDATKEEQVQKLMQKAKNTFGSIDIFLHMIGGFYGGKMIWETESKELDRLFEVVCKSAFLCAKHVIPLMLEKRRGRIIFFPNRLALEPRAGFGVNAISKSGLLTLTHVLREELKDTNITVNAICPSVIDLPKTRAMPFEHAEKGVKPEEIANLLSCVCSDECNALSGSILKVFGEL